MEDPSILSFDDLHVRYGAHEAVKGVSFNLARGEVAAIVGESGSGKSQTVLAAMRLLGPDAQVEGQVLFEGKDLLRLPTKELDAIRGRRIAMIFQEPMSALDPFVPVGAQIAAVLRQHLGLSRAAAKARAIELIDLVGIPDPARRARAYVHELSGGQRQRVAIAMAVACNPEILIADEPTTALDVTVEARILDLITELKTRLGMAMIFISHDLGLVRRFADVIHVMQAGEIVESGPAHKILTAPEHDYTKMLLAAAPQSLSRAPQRDAPTLLEARDLCVQFSLRGGLFATRKEIKAVDHVDLTLRQGQTLGLVGESGSGKSTLGRALLKLVPASGHISFEDRDLTPLDRRAMRPLRHKMQLVFQDPYGSLSPRMTIGDTVTEGLRVHELHLSRADRDTRAAQALDEVRLDAALRYRFPNELSGGQRQRVAIARAMILKPKLVVLDEPTSALDRSVQADILDLLAKLQRDHGLSYVFISHDLSVVRAMAEEIAVMKDGRIVERGKAADLLTQPKDPYTQGLIAAAALKALQVIA
ncbi:ABC transporter ATP-binding protein [Methyloferula stellata]|uniref:ABC transporter ATP-binding protein n=1 Tax=Methyloferula stellata TaxID=876270 RepID=UPI00036EEB82|nr:dipeptide ABC transporter ATP-binding protein [Methyloferula stellata]